MYRPPAPQSNGLMALMQRPKNGWLCVIVWATHYFSHLCGARIQRTRPVVGEGNGASIVAVLCADHVESCLRETEGAECD